MAHILYPSLQEPPRRLDGSKNEAHWHQPWSEPYLTKEKQAFIARMASGQSFDPYPLGTPEFVGPDKWWQQWRERLYPKPGLRANLQQFLAYSESAQFPEVVYIDKYLYPFGLPVWHKARLATGSQPYFATGAHNLGTPFARGYVIC